MPGFGFGPHARKGRAILGASGGGPSLNIPRLAPSESWTGAGGSGYSDRAFARRLAALSVTRSQARGTFLPNLFAAQESAVFSLDVTGLDGSSGGLIFESGASGEGHYVGFRSDGRFVARFGLGGNLPNGRAAYLFLPPGTISGDGTLVWEIKLPADGSPAKISVWWNNRLAGEAYSTNPITNWTGAEAASYLVRANRVCLQETQTAAAFTSASPLRYHRNQLASDSVSAAGNATPSDPVRTSAKPACRLMVPPSQFFTDELVVGVAAAANNQGSLFDNLGLDHVTFHLEGASHQVTSPGYHRFTDVNGNEARYLGWWIRLKKPAALTGEMQLYVEAVPSDTSMQARVMGPYAFHAADTLHDVELRIAPSQSQIPGKRYKTLSAAANYLRTITPQNPRITIAEAGEYDWAAGSSNVEPVGYVTIEASAPVTFAKPPLSRDAQVETNALMRPRVEGIWFKGANITLDFRYMSAFHQEGIKEHVLEGVTLTNSAPAGRDDPWRGGPRFVTSAVRGSPYFLEVTATHMHNVCSNANLVRGGRFTQLSQDIFAEARCVIGTQVEDHSDAALRNDTPAFSVTYTGGRATATIARSGASDPASANYTVTWGASSASFTVGNTVGHYAGTSGDGYRFSDLVTWINGLGAGFSAVLLDDSWRASSGSLAGLASQGFGATSIKGKVVQIVSSFNWQGDWYQQRNSGMFENVIAYDNRAIGLQTRNIFLASTKDAWDYIFFNNAFANDALGNDYFDSDLVFSRLGNNNIKHSHLVIAHCTLANQGLSIRTNRPGYDLDSYCLIANNVARVLTFSGAVDGDVQVSDNHVHAGKGIAGSNGSSSGNTNTLFGNALRGDFSAKGALANTLKPARIKHDLTGKPRGNTAPAGARA